VADKYSIPVDFNQLMAKGGRLATVELHESIRQNILLMLISRWGSLRVDPAFGCAFWEHDFESSTQLENKRHMLEASINQMIIDREPRLDPAKLKVSFKVYNSPLPSVKRKRMLSLKKRIEMVVEGRMLETNKTFRPPPYLLYFSPVAIEHKPGR